MQQIYYNCNNFPKRNVLRKAMCYILQRIIHLSKALSPKNNLVKLQLQSGRKGWLISVLLQDKTFKKKKWESGSCPNIQPHLNDRLKRHTSQLVTLFYKRVKCVIFLVKLQSSFPYLLCKFAYQHVCVLCKSRTFQRGKHLFVYLPSHPSLQYCQSKIIQLYHC